jgi:hypothetical protein
MRLSLAPLNSTAMAEDPAIAQDDLGLLHGTFTRVTKPVQEHDFSGFGQVGQFLVTPDGRRVVFHQTTEDDKNNFLDRVVAMDVATAKVEKVLDEAKGIAEIRMPMQITEDGKGLLMGESDGVDVYDLAAGTLVKHYEAPKDQTVTWVAFSSDSKEVVGGTEDGGALVWKLGTDKPAYIKLDLPKESSHAAFPLTGRDDLLVVVRPRSEGAKTRITLVDPKTMKATLLTEFEGNVDVRPTSDGKRVYVFRQEDPGEVVWTSIEEWDLQTAKMSSKRPLKPPLSSIGLKLSQDGNTLFLHEYLAQPVIMWDLKQGKFLASVAPEMGGCQAFDTTPDGKQLVAVVGQWIQGTLVPQKLAVYDTSALVSGAGMSKK